MSRELKLFDNFFTGVPSLFNRNFNTDNILSADFGKIMNGKCDFNETDDNYEIQLEVPGIKKDEIIINLKNDLLTINWRRKKEKKESKSKNSFHEISEGSFSRSFNVSGADPDKINAELKNGMLKITVSKSETEKPKLIKIN